MDEQIKTDDNVVTSTSKVKCIMAEHDYCIKEDTLESHLPQDNFVEQMEVKSTLDCNAEIKEEILETNSLEENFVEVGEIKSGLSEASDEYSNSSEFPKPVEHDRKQVQIEKPKMKVKGVEIYKYVKGKRDLTPIYQTKKSFKDYLAQEKGEQLDTETQILQGDNLESDLSEDNFVGLCEIKSEFSETNDEFMENQSILEIDPLEVQTENNSTVLDYDCNKKSSLNCNFKTIDKEEFVNHIASIDQGNVILDKGINIREKQEIFHVDKKVKIQLRFSCPSKNCKFKTLVRKEIKDHMQSVHKGDIRFYTTFREKIYEPEVEKRAVPSTSKPNVKSLKYQEVLKLKSFQDYVAGLNKDRFT